LRVGSIVATALVLILQGLAALALMIISVHGPAGLGIAAVVYMVFALGLTSWVATRYRTIPALAGIGLLSVAAVPAIVAGLDRIERIRYDRRIAATRVSDVRDEPILSSTTGRPIGVRVSYSVSVPERGYFGITPWLSSRDPKAERLLLAPSYRRIDERPFEAGRTRAMVFELYPRILVFTKDDRCLERTWLTPLPESTAARPLAITISETRYGETYHGGREEFTTGSYDLAELYRGVIAEGLNPCPSATPSP
jgi:hypothetical protein